MGEKSAMEEKYTIYLQFFHFIHNFPNIKTKKIKPPLGNTSVFL